MFVYTFPKISIHSLFLRFFCLVIFLLGVKSLNYSQGFFTNRIMVLSSYPNIQGNKICVRSYHEKIIMDFSKAVGAFSVIQVIGKQYGDTLYVDDYKDLIVLQSWKWSDYIAQFRITLSQKILTNYPNSGALILALVLGNRFYLDKDTQTRIQFSGLAHLFALSGLHLVLLMALFLGLFHFTNLSYRFILFLSLFLALLYLFLGGFAISLQRAFLAYFLWAFFQIIRLPLSNKKNLLLCFLINVIIFPNNMGTLSFILSYSAILGIVFFYQIYYDRLKHLPSLLATNLALSFSAQLFVIPIVIFHFGFINILAIIFNLLFIPVMNFILLGAFILVFILMVGINNFTFGDLVLTQIQKIMLTLLNFSVSIPYGIWIFRYKIIISLLWGMVLSLVLWRYYVGRKKT